MSLMLTIYMARGTTLTRDLARASGHDPPFPRSQKFGCQSRCGKRERRNGNFSTYDLANAACFLMENYDGPDWLNVGVGEDLTIAELAALVARVVGYSGRITFDPSRPDGTPRELLDVTRIHGLGWRSQIPLEQGIATTYQWYLTHASEGVSA